MLIHFFPSDFPCLSAISGGGLTSSMISNTSVSSAANANILGTCSGSSGAPIPPSLDSLPQMSKSITSSEGDRLSDRLSDRFLGSPDERVLPGQFDDLGLSDNNGEDGYSTLTRERGPSSSILRNNILSAHAVLSRPSDINNLVNDEENSENDPNYESVDELRAKVSLLKSKDDSWRATPATPLSPSHVTVVDLTCSPVKIGKQSSSDRSGGTGFNFHRRRRRPSHDYEEVDVSPPTSPKTPVPTTSHVLPTQNGVLSEEAVVRERVLNGHTYEEVSEVQQSKKEKGHGRKRSTSESANKPGVEKEKKKSKEDKKKTKAEDKKKNGESNSRGNTWDGSKKSNSWEANRTRL